MEKCARAVASSFRHNVGVGCRRAIKDLEIGTVYPEPVTGIKTHLTESVRPDAAARIKRDAAAHGSQVSQDVVSAPAKPFFLAEDCGEVPLPRISSNEFYIVDNPVADRNNPPALHLYRSIITFIEVSLWASMNL